MHRTSKSLKSQLGDFKHSVLLLTSTSLCIFQFCRYFCEYLMLLRSQIVSCWYMKNRDHILEPACK